VSLKFHFSTEPKSVDLKKLDAFKKIISNPKTQFFHTFERTELLDQSNKIFERFKERRTFVHIGIGGSSLGPEMLVSALKKNDRQFLFINNIDPDEIFTQLEDLQPENCLFYFVSKSGGTAETMATLSIVTQFLARKKIGTHELANYFVFATDPVKSELLDLGRELGVTCLEVPSDVGGRFCALTPVGFVPALFAGMNIDQLALGARSGQKICLQEGSENLLLKTADFLFNLKKEQNISQTVLMPYSSKLRSFSFWFTQLWAESLGKKNLGFTPIVGYGATDQHSQMQLFMEGPADKCLVFIEVENFEHDYELASSLKTKTQEKLSSFKLSQLMKAELVGTIKALAENKRPTLLIQIERNNEFHMGELIVFFESLTALMGDYLLVDPFDQPGVEAGKIFAFHFLNQLK
jgi:glucose-6-phosphate isomerase